MSRATKKWIESQIVAAFEQMKHEAVGEVIMLGMIAEMMSGD